MDVRGEEKTALLGDILINCRSADPSSPPLWSEKTVNVIINLPVRVANNTGFGVPSDVTDAVLVVNENNCTTPAEAGGSYACGGRFQDPAYGRKTASRELAWDNVTVPFPGAPNPRGGTNPSTTTIRIISMRGDVSQLGQSADPIAIQSIISTEPPSTLALGVAAVTIASSQRSLSYSVANSIVGQQCVASRPDFPPPARINIRETAPSAFRVRGSPSYHPAELGSESGYYAPGSYNGGGASGPTKIGLLLSNIPKGVNLSVPSTVQKGSLRMTVAGKACGAAGSESISIDLGGNGQLVYEVCASDPQAVEDIEIRVTASWAGDGSVEPGAGKVQVTFVPSSGGVPSFVETGIPLNLVRIEECTVPPPSKLKCGFGGSQTTARGEDLTARLGDVILNCVSNNPDLPAPAQDLIVDLSVALNVPVTNNIDFGAGSDRIDAVLVVNGNDCSTPAATGNSFACGGAYQDPQYGRLSADGRTVLWDGIRVPYPGATNPNFGQVNPDVTTLRFTSLRGNAYTGSVLQFYIQAVVEHPASEAMERISGVVNIARTWLGSMYPTVTRDISGRACSDSPTGSPATAIVNIAEQVNTAFKTKGLPGTAVLIGQESGYFAPGSNDGGGASSATLIRLAFTDVPEGVTLQTPITVTSGTLSLGLADRGCGSAAELAAVSIDTLGSGDVIYQVCSANAGAVEAVDVPIKATWSSGSVASGAAKIRVSYAPVGGPPRASQVDPEPRFVSVDGATDYSEGFLNVTSCSLTSQLAVIRDLGRGLELFLVPGESDGGGQLTSGGGSIREHEWSPDGSRVAFVNTILGGDDIYVVDILTSTTQRLTANTGTDHQPKWSPDGSKILFRREVNEGYELFVMKSNGSGQTNLTNSPEDDKFANWSPDGSKIAFMRLVGGQEDIFVMNADGSGQFNASDSPWHDSQPVWSPDGSKILFQSNRGGGSEIFVMNANGSGQTRLTTTFDFNIDPHWSPDGSKIAFMKRAAGMTSLDIYVMNSDGSDPTRLTDDLGKWYYPRWSPDGAAIAFVEDQGGSWAAYSLDLSSKALTWVSYVSPALTVEWRPPYAPTPPPGDPPPVDPPPVDPPPVEEEELYLTKFGIYNDGRWLKDDNGNGILADEVETSFGFKGATPIAGDWDGDGKQEMAVYANIFGTGFWFRDINGNAAWDDGIDKLSLLGWGDNYAKPIVGDWNGDGRTKIGIYSNGLWLLDYDGNGFLNGNDKVFEFGGWDGSIPLVGDWNGDGRDSAGIYVPGHFVLDYNADHHFENGPEDRVYEFGISGPNAVPVIGDWTGDGKKKVGIFRSGQWLLDLNGDGQANGTGEGLFFYGPREASPVIGDWAGIGKDTIGAIDDGAWYLDVNGDRAHDGRDPILFWGVDGADRVFIPGKWKSPRE